ncbi:MAG TPA: aminoglycoside phosphotransferase family protein [Desulfurivibrionaceae bacterium]|nr:aminoglycoside phosphotransferase family protein [Desulfurivibrionaceae bacterium]
MTDLPHVASLFAPNAAIAAIVPHGNGNVNDTYLVQTEDGRSFILQRLNARVFHDPGAIMHNLRVISRHLMAHCAAGQPTPCWRVVAPLATASGQDVYADTRGGWWRALSYIDNAVAFDTIQSPDHAREIGLALGLFQRQLADLDPGLLHDTLPGFHVTPRYLAEYQAAQATASPKQRPEITYCRTVIDQAAPRVNVLETARAAGIIRERIIHGDPKVANILLDRDSGRAAALIDLDTVKPGLPHYDVGDCLRSACNPLGEEAGDPTAVSFDLDIAEAILRGYLAEAGAFLRPAEIALFPDAAWLIALELGLRFFTDFLAGNVYFKTAHPEQNLHRALVQFQLAASITSQEKALRHLVAGLSQHG